MVAFPIEPRGVVRTMDARHLNAVANHPEVRASLGGDGPVDLTAAIENPEHLAFITSHGGFLVLALGAGRYDVHSLFLPEGRGQEAFDAMHEARDYVFSATDCTSLRTTVTEGHRGAGLAARRLGFTPLFRSRINWTGSTRIEADFLELSLDRWALASDATWRAGTWFHDQLTQHKQDARSTLPVHDEDSVHDHMVGAAVLMMRAGQPEKARTFYNVWAQVAGYAQIQLLRTRPIIVDVVDAIIEVGVSDMEVLTCR